MKGDYMSDEIQEAVTTQEPTTAAESPTAPENGGGEIESTTTTNDTTSAEDSQETTQPEVKESRGQRRIHDLVEKLKSKDQGQQPTQPRQPSPFDAPDPFDQLTGEITKEQLKNLITSEAYKMANLVTAQNEQVTQYRQSVDSHISDLEATGKQIDEDFKNNPKVADKINAMLIQINDQANFDSSGRLTPKVKASDIYKQLKETLQSERTNSQSEVTVAMAKRLADESPKPGASTKPKADLDEIRANMWKDPTAARKAIEERLGVH